MSQDTFSLFLQDAHKQTDPVMLLFVLARVELEVNATEEQRLAFANGEGGKLRPVSCFSSSLSELSDFNALKASLESNSQVWDIVFMATVTGANSQFPNHDEIGNWLKMMVDSVVAGNVGQFIALNLQGERLSFD